MNKNRTQTLALFLVIIMGIITGTELGNIELHNNSVQENYEFDNIMENPKSQEIESIEFNVVDVRNWELNHQEYYLLSSIEGIINKNNSELFIIYENVDLDWLTDLNSTPYCGSWLYVNNLSELITYYSDKFDGIIIWDNLPESGNIGTPLTGINNFLLIHGELYEEAETWPTIGSYSIEINLTQLFINQGFNSASNRSEIYRWAFNTYFEECNQSAFGMLDQGINRFIRSFLCSEGIFTYWQPMYCEGQPDPPDSDEDLATFEYMLQESPENMVVLGYMKPYGCNEHPVVRELTKYGKYLIPSDFFRQMPFWKNLPINDSFVFDQSNSRSIDNIPLEDKVYVAGIYSDGDNLQYVANFMRSHLWNGKHGTVPTTYEMTPSIYNLAPAMAMQYYKEMTPNDYFVNGVGGKGYVKSEFASEEFFSDFWTDTRDLMKKLDQREVRTWDSGDTKKIIELMKNSDDTIQVDSIIEGYGGDSDLMPYLIDNIPFMRMKGTGFENSTFSEDDKEFLLDLLKYKPSGPLFINLHLIAWNCPYDIWVDIVHYVEEESDGQIVFVTSGQLSQLMIEADLDKSEFLYQLGSIISIIGIGCIMLYLSLNQDWVKIKEKRQFNKEADIIGQ